MSEVINILMKEHENILKFVEILEEKSNSMEKKIDKEFFRKAIDFIRNYADKFHHAKEEDILFKEFNKCAEEGCVHCNPVEQMLYEHDLGRNFVKGIEEGLKENNNKKITENSLGYIQLIKEHIFKEDNILYPMAEESLSEKTKKEMAVKFEKIAKERKKETEKNIKFVKSLK